MTDRQSSTAGLRSWGQFAVVGGREFPYIVQSHPPHQAADAILLLLDPQEVALFAPEKVTQSGGRYSVRVPVRDVARFFSRGHTARWYGEEVGVVVVDDQHVRVVYDRDPRLAELMGLEGNQYDGFTAVVPVSELTELVEVVTPHGVGDWYGYDPDGTARTTETEEHP
jgi:hypothetical protein